MLGLTLMIALLSFLLWRQGKKSVSFCTCKKTNLAILMYFLCLQLLNNNSFFFSMVNTMIAWKFWRKFKPPTKHFPIFKINVITQKMIIFYFFFSAKLTRIEGSLFSLLPTSEAAILYINPEERCPSPLPQIHHCKTQPYSQNAKKLK